MLAGKSHTRLQSVGNLKISRVQIDPEEKMNLIDLVSAMKDLMTAVHPALIIKIQSESEKLRSHARHEAVFLVSKTELNYFIPTVTVKWPSRFHKCEHLG